MVDISAHTREVISCVQTRDAIYKAYEEARGTSHRPHLGASLIGRSCPRSIWYTFRWALDIEHEGRLLRLFDTGNHEEPRMVKDLRDAGVTVLEVDPDNGRQWQVRDETGHFGGSMDGVALGIHEAPKTWHLLEFKTHNAKSFKSLVEKGVRESKPEHWAQMMAYMHLAGLKRAFYMAKNKDTDELYTERLRYDKAEGERILEKAHKIVNAAYPPTRPFTADWYECRWCDYRGLCHGEDYPDRNCRTCLHSSPGDEGSWGCQKWARLLDLSEQETGCGPEGHRYIPDLIPGVQTDYEEDTGDVLYQMRDGRTWKDEGV